ncbi:hypothetical protein RQP46_004352 [Phenoliferia psychrophenolica]
MPGQHRARKLAKTLHPSPSRSPSPSPGAFESPAAGPSHSSATSTQSIKFSTTTFDGLTDDDEATVDSSRETTPEVPTSPYSSWADRYEASVGSPRETREEVEEEYRARRHEYEWSEGMGDGTSATFLKKPEYARQPGTFSRLLGGEFSFKPDLERAPLSPFLQIGPPHPHPQSKLQAPSTTVATRPTYPSEFLGLPFERFRMVLKNLNAEPSIAVLRSTRWSCALTCRTWYYLFAADDLHRHIHLAGDNAEMRDLVACKMVAAHEARIAGNLSPFITESYIFHPRGVITGEENLYKGLMRTETVKSLEVYMGHVRTDEEEKGLDGFAVADFLLFQGFFQNLVSIRLTPGPACTQLDIRHRLVTAPLRNLRKLCIGDTARTHSDGLPNALYSLLSGVTESFELELVFSDTNSNCPMVHCLAKLVTEDPALKGKDPDYLPHLASSLISLKFSRATPPHLVQAILPLAAGLRTLITDHDLEDTHLEMFLTAPLPLLTTLGISPIGFLEERPFALPRILTQITNALRDGAFSALTAIEYHSRDSKVGRLMAIEDGEELLELEDVCEGMGIAMPERSMPTLDDPL